MELQMISRRIRVKCGAAICAALVVASGGVTRAHPLSQGRMEWVIHRDKITLWARVALEQVVVQQSLPTDDDGLIKTQSDAYRAHGAYLLKHVFLSVDGKPLEGHVVSIQEPDNKTLVPGEPGKDYVTYEIDYAVASPPGTLELRQNVMNEVEYAPNNPWQATYITGIRQDDGTSRENLLLMNSNALTFECNWKAVAETTPPAPKPAQKNEGPPENLSQPIPEAAPSRTHFIAGVAIGVCIIYLLATLCKKWRRDK